MFGTVLILIITALHIYVLWRAASVPFLKQHVSQKLLISAGLVLWLAFFSGHLLGHGGTGKFASVVELFGMNWMAVLFLAFVCLFAVDLVSGFGFFLPRRAPLMRGWALMTGGLLSVIALVQGLRPPVVTQYDAYLSGLPAELDGKVLVVVTDLHLGSLLDAHWLEARVKQIQGQKPDMVVLLGDLFEGHGLPQDELFPILRRISASLGVWSVQGNHENHGGDTNTSLIKETGFRVLRNSWVEVRPGLILTGIDDLTSNQHSENKSDFMAKALAGRPLGATILLSHSPLEADKAAKAGVGLMLSGHTHGGQIWPFNYLVKRVYPLFAGQYDVEGMTMIVSRGTGTWGPRMRLWRPSEILRVKLHPKRGPP
jgi:predicted MPP superfamily phosphohydrolase